MGVNSSAKKWQAKIGLMYVSDYMYSASPKYWTYPGFTDANNPDINGNYGANYDYRAVVEENWLFMGLYEWTISRVSNDNRTAFYIHNNGNVHNDYVNNYNAVRPVFYIIEEVQIFEGADGTEDNPYRIAI